MPQQKRRPPDLDHCIQVLLRLQNFHLYQSPKLFGEIYVSGIGLLYHLKLDLKTIKEIRVRHKGKTPIPHPKANAIPAISAVVHNQGLFRALISSLSPSATDVEVSDSARGQNSLNGSRKRTASMDIAPVDVHSSSKSMKLSHSPHVAKRSVICYGRPQMNVKLLAATILFVAFQHLDHWPAAFVRVYSEDCFGPRSWVDEASCRLFVENLALSHTIAEACDNDTPMIDAQTNMDALAVSEFYETNTESISTSSTNTADISRHQSHGSLASNESVSVSSVQQIPTDPASSGSGVKPTPATRAVDSDEQSDSGEEEEVLPMMASAPLRASKDDGDSSSSGEGGDDLVASTRSYSEDENGRQSLSPGARPTEAPPNVRLSYPIEQQDLNFTAVRQRYFGVNLESAQRAIASSLQQRLDVRSKQNSGLLQTLPLFATVPDVRRLITANLEKWLQSPALAGLARSLFAHTVSLFRNVDPLLPADLEAIDNVLSMKLKANQLNAHVENIKSIARKIPTASVANHLYSRLLEQLLTALDSVESSASDHLKMIHGVHGVFPASMRSAAIATALMGFHLKKPEAYQAQGHSVFLDQICKLLRSLAHDLGPAFGGLELVCSIADFRAPDSAGWTQRHESDRARVLYQCALLSIGNPTELQNKAVQRDASNEHETAELLGLRATLSSARKVMLKWFCEDFAGYFTTDYEDGTNARNGMIGAGIADYSSILDGMTTKKLCEWETTLRALVFLEPPDSAGLKDFLPSNTSGELSSMDDTVMRASLCFEFGGNVDDEMVQIVVQATGSMKPMPPSIALGVLEHLFHGCRKDQRAIMSLTDPTLLWTFYQFVEYTPRPSLRRRTSSESGMDEIGSSRAVPTNEADRTKASDLPRLAYSGLWWRATCLALIVCGASPETIGRLAWNEHPTLNTLMKMVTSDRYRFPTVDCDDNGREAMKKSEQSMRDEEARITEALFLPPKIAKPVVNESQSAKASFGGSRISRRQQEKRENQLKEQRKKDALDAQKEANRRRKLLRVAQKSIMLWDPRQGPRKPPKESADLIFSVGEQFDLQRKFQRTTEPDFLLKTIGSTSRGAIERAYDWLIPIISVVPETIVRLPASASCFLLLRAYGAEREERAQLQELSTPLLSHVRESLMGSFGEADAVRAADLLLGDLASQTAERRRCVRKVLHDAIGKETAGDVVEPFANSNCSWMLNLLNVKHTDRILPGGIRRLAEAASFERGRVLRFLLLALDKLTEVATEKKLMGDFRFSSTLMRLVSSRPAIFASTMASFPDLRALAMRLVISEFRWHIGDRNGTVADIDRTAEEKNEHCYIALCCSPDGDRTSGPTTATLPVALLESSCVLLSIWGEEDDAQAIERLVAMLMPTAEEFTDGEIVLEETETGLASATLSPSGQPAMPVESWVMLARSRSDFVAKRAALTAPTSFIPRLLLCSGLPQASLLFMIDRLGKLGERAENLDKLYTKLLVPSATSEWDIGRVGKKKEVSRKLLGRLSAYARMYKISESRSEEGISTTFLGWLSRSNQNLEKPRRQRAKEGKPTPGIFAKTFDSLKILEAVTAEPIGKLEESEDLKGDVSDMSDFLKCHDRSAVYDVSVNNIEEVSTFFVQAIKEEQLESLEVWLQNHFGGTIVQINRHLGTGSSFSYSSTGLPIACLLLNLFSNLERKSENLGATLVKWVPVLSAQAGCPELWTFLLTDGQKPGFLWSNLISRCAQTWSRGHAIAFRDWILSHEDLSALDLAKVIRFFMQSTSWSNVHSESLANASSGKLGDEWRYAEQSVKKVLDFSIAALVLGSESGQRELLSVSRNDLPEALVLLLLLCRFGRKHAQLVSQTLVERLSRENGKVREILLASVLRVYAYFPHFLNLGVATLRTALKEAVDKFAGEWLSWRSPMDDMFEDHMLSLSIHHYQQNQQPQTGPTGYAVPALLDDAKKHPLLILRKLGRMEELLEEDATSSGCLANFQSLEGENRGVIVGRSLAAPMPAKVGGNAFHVTVQHWGYSFTEQLWISILEIVTSVHHEVLFDCGFRMGLDKFLGAYLRLLSVQTQLIRTTTTSGGDRLLRLKGKVSDFLTALQASNKETWDEWLKGHVDGLKSLGTTRNVLLSCDLISFQEAVANMKTSPDQLSVAK